MLVERDHRQAAAAGDHLVTDAFTIVRASTGQWASGTCHSSAISAVMVPADDATSTVLPDPASAAAARAALRIRSRYAAYVSWLLPSEGPAPSIPRRAARRAASGRRHHHGSRRRQPRRSDRVSRTRPTPPRRPARVPRKLLEHRREGLLLTRQRPGERGIDLRHQRRQQRPGQFGLHHPVSVRLPIGHRTVGRFGDP